MRALALALVCASGCGGGSSMHAPVELALGTAATDGSGFLPLEGDQTLVEGAQGGFHVWVKYRLRGMQPQRVEVKRTARRVSDDRLILQADGTIDVGDAGSDGWWESPNATPSFMCPTPVGVNVVGEAIVFDVTVLDAGGHELGHATAEATPRCPDGGETAFCQMICTG